MSLLERHPEGSLLADRRLQAAAVVASSDPSGWRSRRLIPRLPSRTAPGV